MGYSRKNPHPHDRRPGFFYPPPPLPPGIPKLLEPPLLLFTFKDPLTHSDFHEIVRYHNFNSHSM